MQSKITPNKTPRPEVGAELGPEQLVSASARMHPDLSVPLVTLNVTDYGTPALLSASFLLGPFELEELVAWGHRALDAGYGPTEEQRAERADAETAQADGDVPF